MGVSMFVRVDMPVVLVRAMMIALFIVIIIIVVGGVKIRVVRVSMINMEMLWFMYVAVLTMADVRSV